MPNDLTVSVNNAASPTTSGNEMGIEPSKEKSYTEICAGDIDVCNGRKILYVVYARPHFIVTIDEQLGLNWRTAHDFNTLAEDFGEVVGSCELSDALVDRIFSDKANRMAYKKMLGAVIARILDDKKSTSARKKLAIVDQRINEHGRERMRMVYIYSSLTTVCVLGLLFTLLLIVKTRIANFGFSTDVCAFIRCCLLGGIAAFLTTFARFQHYRGSLVAGVSIHRLDGILRIVYGMIAGLIIVLAIKANVLVGFANASTSSLPWILYFLAMMAGASEILIPNLIRQTEGELGIQKLEQKETEIAVGKKEAPKN
jgi:hypothetical protein